MSTHHDSTSTPTPTPVPTTTPTPSPQDIRKGAQIPRRTWLAHVIYAIMVVYRNTVLLGFHSHYIDDIDHDTASSSPGQLDAPTSTSRPRNDRWTMFVDGANTFGPLVLSGLSVYSSMSSSDSGEAPLLRTVGVITGIISGNASLLSVLFVYWESALSGDQRNAASSAPSSPSTAIASRAEQIAMLKSIPLTGAFWSWILTIAYRGSSYIIAKLGLPHAEASDDGSDSPQGPVSAPPWHVGLAFAVLILCLVHLILVVAWLNSLNLRSDLNLTLPTVNQHASPPSGVSELPSALEMLPLQPVPTDETVAEERVDVQTNDEEDSSSQLSAPNELPTETEVQASSEPVPAPFTVTSEIIRQRSKATSIKKSTSASSGVSVHLAPA